MNTANALYEGHRDLVENLRQQVEKILGLPVGYACGGQTGSQMLKDATTAYVMAVDKFLSFHSTMTRADGTTVSSFGFKFDPESIEPS